jgi:hypothetical protein
MFLGKDSLPILERLSHDSSTTARNQAKLAISCIRKGNCDKFE